jgi:hypothetical protein
MILIWHTTIFLGLNSNPNHFDLTSLQSNLSSTYYKGLEKIDDLSQDVKSFYSGSVNWDSL